MQSGSVEITPGKVFNEQDGETVDLEKLNRMVQEAVLRVMAKSITAREIADNAITSDQLDVNLSAQIGVPDGSVTPGKLAAGFVLAVAKGGTGGGTAATARSGLECLRTDFKCISLDSGTDESDADQNLYQTANGTYTYKITGFAGTDLDTGEIRELYVACAIDAASSGTRPEITASYPDGSTQSIIKNTNSSVGADTCVAIVPIDSDTDAVTFTLLGNGTKSINIFMARQRVFESY